MTTIRTQSKRNAVDYRQSTVILLYKRFFTDNLTCIGLLTPSAYLPGFAGLTNHLLSKTLK